ncbi:RES family NAD+ phosphorylase [Massilia sp. TWR1-2-2]|uniref:RES family NAD+ phosphorylase n=1 Tax=Massilia sp. TWR1-2-2 TaxID=2804584 RepID=UPI003CEB21B2
MPATAIDLPSPPPHVAARLPSAMLLRQALLASIRMFPAGQPLVRAAWHAAAVFPQRVDVTYRFGPPAAWRVDGAAPFHWNYAAADEMTAVWEAGLCRNDVTDPGTFYVAPGAEAAIIARLLCATPLALFDLSGITLSKLGLSDDISSPDHEGTQWLGCMLDAVVAEQDGRIAGIIYPSRKQRGHTAYALSSRSSGTLAAALTVTQQRFGGSDACATMMADPCRRPPPR